MFIGFFLSTFLGSIIVLSFQFAVKKLDHDRTDLHTAIELFKNVSSLMDKRLYRMRRIHSGLVDNCNKTIMNKRWNMYREILFDWNENLNKNFALIQIYFGQWARNNLEKNIQRRFKYFGGLIEGNIDYPEEIKDKSEYRQRVADSLNTEIYEFDKYLIQEIQNENILSNRE